MEQQKTVPVSGVQPRTRPEHEIHRVPIPPPMATQPYDYQFLPKPVLADGTRVQVTSFVSEHGEIVERWQFSDTDVRWYRLEAYKGKRITIKVEKRTSVG